MQEVERRLASFGEDRKRFAGAVEYTLSPTHKFYVVLLLVPLVLKMPELKWRKGSLE
jgi:hypothetical protein